MTNVIGPDVSFYQDDNNTPQQIDFAKMATQSPFVIIRAGQNLWPDPDLRFNMREAKAVELIRGSYWFYDSRADPLKQAQKYVETLDLDKGELPMFADFEDKYGGPYGGWKNWYNFLEELKRLSDMHEIAIYTGYYYWIENTIQKGIPKESLAYFKQYQLWIANYGAVKPLIPAPWTDWMFWQYTDNGDGTLYGVESLNIDLNHFNGDLAKIKQLYGDGPVVVEPPTEGENMAPKFKVTFDSTKTTSPYVNLRSLASAAAEDLGDFKVGQVGKGDLIVETKLGEPWLKLLEIDDKPVVGDVYIAAWLCKLEPNEVVTPLVFGQTRLDSIYSSDGPFQIEDQNGTIFYTSGPTGGTIKISSIEKIVIRTP